MKNKLIAITAGVLILASGAFAKTVPDTLENRVRHELVMLPYLTLFDDLSYRVDGTTVTLFGQVVDPVLKSDAAKVVKHVEGVTAVNDQVEVLPLSPMDNGIRWREYRAIYAYAPLQRYRMGVLPSIHIIVDNGHVTLKGVVGNAMDKQLAFMRANAVPGVFSVTNDLQVEK